MVVRFVQRARQENKFPEVTVKDFEDVQVWKNYGVFMQKESYQKKLGEQLKNKKGRQNKKNRKSIKQSEK
jgi:hypothetical protein